MSVRLSIVSTQHPLMVQSFLKEDVFNLPQKKTSGRLNDNVSFVLQVCTIIFYDQSETFTLVVDFEFVYYVKGKPI